MKMILANFLLFLSFSNLVYSNQNSPFVNKLKYRPPPPPSNGIKKLTPCKAELDDGTLIDLSKYFIEKIFIKSQNF